MSERLFEIGRRDAAKLEQSHGKYGDSWRKRGGWEAFANLSRKWDRIERAAAMHDFDIFRAIEGGAASDGTVDGKDSLLDDIGDLRRYLLLVEEYVTRPDNAFSVGGEAEARNRARRKRCRM